MKCLLGAIMATCMLCSFPAPAWSGQGTTTMRAADSTSAHYDPQNPFAKIIRGELPAAKVYEDPM